MRTSARPALLASAVVVALVLAVGAALLLSGAWSVVPSQPSRGGSEISGPRPSERVDASGRLLVPLETGLSLVSLPERTVADVVPVGRSASITSARWAPDAKSAAYTLYQVRTGDSVASSELYVTDFTADPRVVVERDRPGAAIDTPAWAPDGGSIYFSYSALEDQRVVQRIERVDVASGIRAVVTEGILPSVSPDGALLTLVRSDRDGDNLMVARIDGNDPRILIPAGRFTTLGGARFSPDGRTLAVPASVRPGQAREPSPVHPLGLLGVAVAYAHGDPWDVFLIPVEGGEPRRLTRLSEDEISLAWSPDGGQLAVYGSRGLHLVDLEGNVTLALDRGGLRRNRLVTVSDRLGGLLRSVCRRSNYR